MRYEVDAVIVRLGASSGLLQANEQECCKAEKWNAGKENAILRVVKQGIFWSIVRLKYSIPGAPSKSKLTLRESSILKTNHPDLVSLNET